ncbi:hypothetical protein HYC85_027931 [Camellia sinensis]|uniref:Uncharacterized protein n=1 Tax=Camellia sinensis TaxID=4442 RepID=A0A7J7FTP8_CAMSI|nr:hypothetical protein HYC85_027931 [Camellia sinensis]
MATTNVYTSQSSSRRAVAMALALATAVVLSPLYANRRNDSSYETTLWNSGFVMPMLLVGLIIAIKTTSCSSSSSSSASSTQLFLSSEPSWVQRIGSSWGLAGVLVMLMVVLSWQNSVQHFFWR